MAAIPTLQVVNTGAVESLAAANGGGDTFTPDARSMLIVKNAAGAPITVTLALVAPTSVVGTTIPAGGGSVTNGTTKKFGPLDPAVFTGAVAYSSATSVTVAVERI